MFGFLKKKLSELKEKIIGKKEEQEEVEVSKREEIKETKKAEKETSERKKKQTKRRTGKPGKKPKKEERKTKAKKKEIKPESKKVEARVEEDHKREERKEQEEKKPKKEKILTKLKKLVSKKIKLSPEEIEDYLWDLELILLEADVAHEVAEDIISRLRDTLLEKEFSSKEDIFDQIVSELRKALLEMFPDPFNPLEAKSKPVVIMFIGPNGAGKTTTMAKLAKQLLDKGKSVIFAASDTFRAASIEQLEEHANKLGVRVIKHTYGADPAAVAYDAVQSAKAKGIDFVFIDTAGRQETNKNLLEELKKIKRVVEPDYIIYVDEGIAGNVILDRLKSFGDLEISGIILTKMDLDAKGGGAITAASLGIPILFIGLGQDYYDLKPFDKEEFISALLG